LNAESLYTRLPVASVGKGSSVSVNVALLEGEMNAQEAKVPRTIRLQRLT
jgi:hypothetical protein